MPRLKKVKLPWGHGAQYRFCVRSPERLGSYCLYGNVLADMKKAWMAAKKKRNYKVGPFETLKRKG